MIVELKLENEKMERVKIREENNKYFLSFMDRSDSSEFEADFSECGHFYSIVIDNKPFMVKFDEEGDIFSVVSGSYVSKITAENQETRIRRGIRNKFSVSTSLVQTKIPGKILDVLVYPGQKVEKGQDLFVLEAMKMENRIFAQRDGVIKEVMVRKGDVLMTGANLLSYE